MLDHLFFSLLQVFEKKVGKMKLAGANECKVLIPLQFSLMMNTVPKGQIQIPLRPQQKMKVTIVNYRVKFGLVFSGHILSLQQTSTTVLCVCERLKRENGKATTTVAGSKACFC